MYGLGRAYKAVFGFQTFAGRSFKTPFVKVAPLEYQILHKIAYILIPHVHMWKFEASVEKPLRLDTLFCYPLKPIMAYYFDLTMM